MFSGVDRFRDGKVVGRLMFEIVSGEMKETSVTSEQLVGGALDKGFVCQGGYSEDV